MPHFGSNPSGGIVSSWIFSIGTASDLVPIARWKGYGGGSGPGGEPFDFEEGTYYQRSRAEGSPRPYGEDRPLMINAGSSPAGRPMGVAERRGEGRAPEECGLSFHPYRYPARIHQRHYRHLQRRSCTRGRSGLFMHRHENGEHTRDSGNSTYSRLFCARNHGHSALGSAIRRRRHDLARPVGSSWRPRF